MRTVQFRYGFHPEGMDPLVALRAATQPAHADRSVPSFDSTVSNMFARRDTVPVSPRLPSLPDRARRPRRPGLHRYLFAVVVLVSGAIGAVVATTGGEDGSSEVAQAAVEFAPPTVIEPDALPAPALPAKEASTPANESVSSRTSSASQPTSPIASPPVTSPPVASPPVAVPTEPVATTPASPVAVVPSVSLPPAVTWSVEPVAKPEPKKPSIVIPTPNKTRSDVTVRPERKPSLKVPAVSRTRSTGRRTAGFVQ